MSKNVGVEQLMQVVTRLEKSLREAQSFGDRLPAVSAVSGVTAEARIRLTALCERLRDLADEQESDTPTGADDGDDDDAATREYASPPCYRHELDPAYGGDSVAPSPAADDPAAPQRDSDS